ncbi:MULTISPECIES: class I SAM-dependent methyltransferase [Roseobacteraceae]|jgi:SAM-dependent methyltransferase|uniref:class I SAM-dependent methyltransferase n=1 Tax=Roseobacteraceae TaxID=2854170 RepID=UPI00125F05D9|nr:MULTISPECIES: class I SAM-dependent methyltransferase [Roseobacteraceae]KAB6715261.1 SAM-dependent methyltransferase [Roseobacter sp. TSBP12]
MMKDVPSLLEATQANKAAWEASASLHGTGAGWEALLKAASEPGFSTFDTCLAQTLGALDLSGKRAVQIGCNNGRELLSLASFGAVPAVGIDHSGAFLAQARMLSEAAKRTPEWIEANVYELPSDMRRFDFALITIGVLNWMPDLARFFEIVAGLMAPGARLVIYETHPVMEMFDPVAEQPHEPAFSYFQQVPHRQDEMFSYDGQDHGTGTTSYWFPHTLGEIVTSCIRAGLRIERLTEHGHSNREPEYDLYEGRAAQIPMSYTLVARREG